MYIRLGRRGVTLSSTTLSHQISRSGRATRLRDGSDITIMTYGAQVRPSLDAAQRMEKAGFSVRVVDMHTIKPLDFQEIKAAVDETGAILTVEEHNVIGGLGSAMAEALIDLPPHPVPTSRGA